MGQKKRKRRGKREAGKKPEVQPAAQPISIPAWQRNAIIAILLFATALVTGYSIAPEGALTSQDSYVYIRLAKNILNGTGMYEDVTGKRVCDHWGPAYPVLLAIPMKLGMDPIEAGKLINMFAVGGTLVVLYFLGLGMLKKWWMAIIAPVVMLFIAAAWQIRLSVYSEASFILWTLLTVYAFAQIYDSDTRKKEWIWCGVGAFALSMTFLTRFIGSTLFMAMTVAVLCMWISGKVWQLLPPKGTEKRFRTFIRQDPVRKSLLLIGTLAVATAVAFAWLMRNYALTGRLRDQAGETGTIVKGFGDSVMHLSSSLVRDLLPFLPSFKRDPGGGTSPIGFATLCVICLVLAGFIFLKKNLRKRFDSWAVFGLAYPVLYLLFLVYYSVNNRFIAHTRFTVCAYPFVMLYIVFLLSPLLSPDKGWKPKELFIASRIGAAILFLSIAFSGSQWERLGQLGASAKGMSNYVRQVSALEPIAMIRDKLKPEHQVLAPEKYRGIIQVWANHDAWYYPGRKLNYREWWKNDANRPTIIFGLPKQWGDYDHWKTIVAKCPPGWKKEVLAEDSQKFVLIGMFPPEMLDNAGNPTIKVLK